MLLPLTEPPYKIFGDFLPNLFLINEMDLDKLSDALMQAYREMKS